MRGLSSPYELVWGEGEVTGGDDHPRHVLRLLPRGPRDQLPGEEMSSAVTRENLP